MLINYFGDVKELKNDFRERQFRLSFLEKDWLAREKIKGKRRWALAS